MSVFPKEKLKTLLQTAPPLLQESVDPEVQLQPNGFDLSLKEVLAIEGQGSLDFDNSERKLPAYRPLAFGLDGWVELAPGAYLITFNEVVSLPESVMAIGRPRSSLVRMGATLESAVWDAGYQGRSQSLLVVHNPGGVRLKKDARLLQLVFFSVDGGTEAYHGFYQGENL